MQRIGPGNERAGGANARRVYGAERVCNNLVCLVVYLGRLNIIQQLIKLS